MKKIRVVFLEDNRSDMRALTQLLQNTEQFDVVIYDSKIIFEDQIKNSDCDLIILDIDLSKSKGLKSDRFVPGTVVAEEIRTNLPELDHVPILITSAWWDELPQNSFDYEAENSFRGFFSIGKQEWGENGAKLIGKIANIMFRWPSFLCCKSEHSRAAMADRYEGFEFPIWRR